MDPQAEALEARIKSLTTLIHILKPQYGAPTPSDVQSGNAKAYHHIATLLTRGVEDEGVGGNVIAVTGAHPATGAVVTVLSADPAPIASLSNPSPEPPSSPSNCGPPSSPSHPGPHVPPCHPRLSPIDTGLPASTSDPALSGSTPLDKDLANMAVTQSSTPKNTRKDISTTFYRTKVEPNPLTLSEICETLDVSEFVTLSQHAADVLKALNSMRDHLKTPEEYRKLFILSMELILRRCFPEIKHRVSGVKRLFGDNLIPRLESWEPQPTDALDFELIGRSRLLLSDDLTGEIDSLAAQDRIRLSLHSETTS